MGKGKKKKSGIHGLGDLATPLNAEHDIKNTAIETTKDVLVGALGGGVVGAAFGRASLGIGLVITALSHYYKNSLGKVFGVGMMASGGFQKSSSVNGTDDKKADLIEEAKERVMSFSEDFKRKLYLDKLVPAKKDTASKKTTKQAGSKTSSTKEQEPNEEESKTEKSAGNRQHFVYPNKASAGEASEKSQTNADQHLDMSDLEETENGLHRSAAEHLQNSESENTAGLGDTELDPEERNY